MLRLYSSWDGSTEGFYRDRLQPVLVAMSGRKADTEYTSLVDLYNDKEIIPGQN